MKPSLSSPMIRVALGACFALGSPLALALGLGEPKVVSVYGEQLHVRVPVSYSSDKEQVNGKNIRMELLPDSEYEHYGLAPQHIESSGFALKYTEHGNGGWIDITSLEPMREPATILLLRVNLAGMQMVREVPVLFDLTAPAAPETQAPAPAPKETETAAAALPAAPPAAAAPPPGPEAAAAAPVPPPPPAK
ncbi:MAG: hypothetical protein P4L83_23190, partial [Nevskia sp.]|nr:hypothetical protein [Nevskia sp.]